MKKYLDQVFYNNTVQDYLIALGLIIVGLLLVRLLKHVILKKLRGITGKTENHVDDFLVRSFGKHGIPLLNIFIVYAGIQYLILTPRVDTVLSIAWTVALAVFIILFVSEVVRTLVSHYLSRGKEGDERLKQLAGLMILINVLIWAIGLLFLFNNLGYDVTAIIAGMGIGGIAIALAAQNILADLFNYFVILFDQPLEVGDFLVIDDKMGTVEKIGIKTTRIRSLSGEQLVFSNADLMESRLHNFKRMERRRVVFSIGVTYQTPLPKLKQIPSVIESVINEMDEVTFDRSHFKEYGDSSLNFESVYWIELADYNIYMDKHQHVNLRIYEEFEKLGVDIAFPTRTLYINSAENDNENAPTTNERD